MSVQGVGGGNQNLIERFASEVENLATEAKEFVEDLAQQINESASETPAGRLLQQQGAQARGKLDAILDRLNPFDDANGNVRAQSPARGANTASAPNQVAKTVAMTTGRGRWRPATAKSLVLCTRVAANRPMPMETSR